MDFDRGNERLTLDVVDLLGTQGPAAMKRLKRIVISGQFELFQPDTADEKRWWDLIEATCLRRNIALEREGKLF